MSVVWYETTRKVFSFLAGRKPIIWDVFMFVLVEFAVEGQDNAPYDFITPSSYQRLNHNDAEETYAGQPQVISPIVNILLVCRRKLFIKICQRVTKSMIAVAWMRSSPKSFCTANLVQHVILQGYTWQRSTRGQALTQRVGQGGHAPLFPKIFGDSFSCLTQVYKERQLSHSRKNHQSLRFFFLTV